MFHNARDASKVALVHLVARLIAGGFALLDTQYVTEHLRSFGAVEVPRRRYRTLLDKALTGEPAIFTRCRQIVPSAALQRCRSSPSAAEIALVSQRKNGRAEGPSVYISCRLNLERFQAKPVPGLDPGWIPVRAKKTRQNKNLELVVHSQAGDVEIRLRLEGSGQRYADARRRHQKIIGVIVEPKVQVLAPDRPVVGDRIFQNHRRQRNLSECGWPRHVILPPTPVTLVSNFESANAIPPVTNA